LEVDDFALPVVLLVRRVTVTVAAYELPGRQRGGRGPRTIQIMLSAEI